MKVNMNLVLIVTLTLASGIAFAKESVRVHAFNEGSGKAIVINTEDDNGDGGGTGFAKKLYLLASQKYGETRMGGYNSPDFKVNLPVVPNEDRPGLELRLEKSHVAALNSKDEVVYINFYSFILRDPQGDNLEVRTTQSAFGGTDSAVIVEGDLAISLITLGFAPNVGINCDFAAEARGNARCAISVQVR